MLGNNPDNPALNIKALTNDPESQYRLRVGNYRVKYDRDNGIKIVEKEDEYVAFVLSDYIKNPIRVARVEGGLTQKEMARRLKVTQGYISKNLQRLRDTLGLRGFV